MTTVDDERTRAGRFHFDKHRRHFVAGRGFLRALLLIPWVVSAVAASYVWKWLYHSDFGAIGALVVQLGLSDEPINFIDNTQLLGKRG